MGEQLLDESRFYPLRCAVGPQQLGGEAYPALVVGIEPGYCAFK